MSIEAGRRVRVSARAHAGHHRTPAYVKGRHGVVVRTHAAFRNPETRAYGGDGLPERRLHLLGFQSRELWPDDPGRTPHLVLVDVFEHWLEEDS